MPFLPARLLVSMATLGTANLAFANEQPELELAPIYTDHMFLQRDRPTPVTGIANPGAEVSVELAGQVAVITHADAAGPLVRCLACKVCDGRTSFDGKFRFRNSQPCRRRGG